MLETLTIMVLALGISIVLSGIVYLQHLQIDELHNKMDQRDKDYQELINKLDETNKSLIQYIQRNN